MFDELINRTSKAREEDFRLAIINALLRTPHRKVAPYIPLFRYVHEKDPLFFGHLAAWYQEHGSVHDLKQLFIAFMSTSRFSDEYRDAGIAMLQELPPYQVERVLAMIKGHEEHDIFIQGVANSVPRSVRTAIEEYLREREANPAAFDNVVLHARKSLKTLYASLRIKPGEYAQRVLFDNNPPEGSRLFVLKQLAKTENPAEQARLIADNKIPYRVATASLRKITPEVLSALIKAMTPQEVINNLGSLKKRGAMEDENLRALIGTKLEQAETDKRVSALKTRQALHASDLDPEIAKKVTAVGDKQIKTRGKIKRSTAIHVDKSGSMEAAIEVGKQIAAMVAPICESSLYVYAFDTIAYPIKASGKELSDWEKSFKGINAAGGTSCGVALQNMIRKNETVEQLVIVTDQEENTEPYLFQELKNYEKKFGSMPEILIVNVQMRSPYLEKTLSSCNISSDSYTFSGDYYSLPSLLPILAGGTRMELLMGIMDYPLPERKRQLAPA